MRASPCSSVVERFRVLLGNSASMSTHTGHWSSHLYGIDLRRRICPQPRDGIHKEDAFKGVLQTLCRAVPVSAFGVGRVSFLSAHRQVAEPRSCGTMPLF